MTTAVASSSNISAVPTHTDKPIKRNNGPRGSAASDNSTINHPNSGQAINHRPKNAKPDPVFEAKRTTFYAKVKSADTAIESCRHRIAAIFDQLNALRSGDKESSEKTQLRTQLNSLKDLKNKLMNEKKAIFATTEESRDLFKRKVAEMADAKDKLPYKRIEDVKNKIKEMEISLESGTNKLIDEKKMVAEISKLNKVKRTLEGLEGQQGELDRLKKSSDASRTLIRNKDDEIEVIKVKVDELMKKLAALDSNRGSIQAKADILLAEKDKLKKEIDTHIQTKNEAHREYDKAKEAHQLWIEAEKVKREETKRRRDAENVIRELEYEMKRLDEPAGAEQITQSLNIQNFIKINILKQSISISNEVNDLTSQLGGSLSLRQVEGLTSDAVIMKTKSQRDEDGDSFYFVPKAKSGKQGKKTAAIEATSIPTSTTSVSMKLPFWVMTGLSDLGLSAPSTVADAEDLVNNKLEAIKKSYEDKQLESLRTVDTKRSDIQAKIDAEKVKLEQITTEKVKEDMEKSKAKQTVATPAVTVASD